MRTKTKSRKTVAAKRAQLARIAEGESRHAKFMRRLILLMRTDVRAFNATETLIEAGETVGPIRRTALLAAVELLLQRARDAAYEDGKRDGIQIGTDRAESA